MASFYQSTVEEFLGCPDEYVLARLATAYAIRGYTTQYSDQTLVWARDLKSLRAALAECVSTFSTASLWGLLLEFSVPRKERRIDVVLLVQQTVIILEGKTREATAEGRRQLEEYALLLHYFHKGSANRRIVPVLVTLGSVTADLDKLSQDELFPQLASYWIAPVAYCSWDRLSALLVVVARQSQGQVRHDVWNESPYFPVPSIIEAAVALRSGLSIREIAHSEASEHEIGAVCRTVESIIEHARNEGHRSVCFLTGVPGSGKTLVGLSLAHSAESRANAVHFMSGNGPLVQVLQHLFTQESMRSGAPAPQARTEAKTLIENVHVFARNYTEDDHAAPSNHAIVFDEAQRAWNRAQNLKKFGRDYSEPEMLLSIMERHHDWAVIIALVGGGQEINDGEAGLEEWGLALAASKVPWQVYASPEVIAGGASTAGHRLFEGASTARDINTSTSLHLRTSNRSLRAERLATWVNLLLSGDHAAAAALNISQRFPIFLSRTLEATRLTLRRNSKGADRCGLVGSSGAARLRAEGLEPSSTFHANYPWEHWYLAGENDVRSSYRCEVFATEFEIQGLELDWVGLCWGGDFIWDPEQGWSMRKLRHGSPSKWNSINNPEKQTYRRNAYRVLLTRARKGLVIFVPRGDDQDPTNAPAEFDATSHYLLACGVIPLKPEATEAPTPSLTGTPPLS